MAEQQFEKAKNKIGILFTDIVMPNGINGHQLAARLRAKNPDLIVIFTTGFSPEIAGKDFPLEPGQNFLQKPYTEDALLHVFAHALEIAGP